MPTSIGGHPALDYCNTYAGWNEPDDTGVEYLPSYEQLAIWAAHAELITMADAEVLRALADADEASAARVLADAKDLRTAMYVILLDPSAAETFGRLADYVRDAASSAEFVADADGIATWVVPVAPDLGLPLRLIAHAAGQLLCSTDRTVVRACPGHQCGWLFLDRRGRRRWCSMATCGNRAKVRAFEARQRQG